jgi:hypothetical protein
MCGRRLSLYIYFNLDVSRKRAKIVENRRLQQQMTSLLDKDNFLENSQYHVAHYYFLLDRLCFITPYYVLHGFNRRKT